MTLNSRLVWTVFLCITSSFCSPTKLYGSSFGVIGINQTFDYVVVGGGTAGLLVAQRLSEENRASVAVVEAGSFYEIDNGNISQIPAYCARFSTFSPTDIQPLVDWGFVTQPQTELNNSRLHYTQGKCLGGGSARNFLTYHRSSIGAFQKWADTVGDPSYLWDSLLPYFKKSLKFTPPNTEKIGYDAASVISYDTNAFSPEGGPLQISFPNYVQPLTAYYRRGLERIGLKPLQGINSGNLLGFADCPTTTDPKDQTRSSSETSFLADAIAKTNLQVYQNTLAKKILFDANKQATGVQVSAAGVSYVLTAKKEVIVSAGVFRSPQLLMVSGIGPKETLQKHNISVVSDLPVGQTLWDQPTFGISYKVKVITASQYNNPAYTAQVTEEYLTNQTGPLTNIGGDILAWEKLPAKSRSQLDKKALSDLAQFPSDWPEIEFVNTAIGFAPTVDNSNFASFIAVLVAPLSRGAVTINSSDTATLPLVNPNWLTSTTDQQVLVQAFKRLRELAKASDLTVGPESVPGPLVQTDEQILQFIRTALGTIYHGSATCSMGKAGDPNAVVDSKARVFGVSGLRVVDASAFPFTPPGHSMSSVYVLAEKIADDIRNGR